jgi:hypothetical protein
VIVRVLILWAVIALAVALSVLAHQRAKSDESHDYQVALGFVGASYGLLLGLLVVFAVGHYSDTRREAQKEASSLVALWDTLDAYPPETRDAVRHDLICYMRAIVADDWPAMERGSRLEEPRTLVSGDRVRAGVRRLPLDDDRQRSAFGRASTLITDAGSSRQQLLFFTEPEIPNVLWVLIYVGAFLLVYQSERTTPIVPVVGSALLPAWSRSSRWCCRPGHARQPVRGRRATASQLDERRDRPRFGGRRQGGCPSPMPSEASPHRRRGSLTSPKLPVGHLLRRVETMGLEPTTPCLQSRCSSQLSYVPVVFQHATPTARLPTETTAP